MTSFGRRLTAITAATGTALALSAVAFAGTASADTGCTTATGQPWPRGSRQIMTCGVAALIDFDAPWKGIAACVGGEVIAHYVHD